MANREGDLESRIQASWLCTAGLAVQGAAGLAALGAALASGSFAVLAAAVHVLAGALAWGAGLVLASRAKNAALARAEAARVTAAALHREGQERLFPADLEDQEKALERFERRARPALGIAFAATEVAAGLALLFWARSRVAVEEPAAHLGAAATLAIAAFVSLLLARYSLALASGQPVAWVAGGRRAASAAVAALLGAAAIAGQKLAPAWRLDDLGYALAAIEVCLGIETVLALVLEAYRPRRRGEAPRVAYESRLLALLAEPGGVARSLARAVDYQFGFELSATWSYRLLARSVPPLVLFTAACFWALSTVLVVEPHERAIVERLGRVAGEPRGPGLHLLLPWPLDVVRRIDADRLREVVVGPAEDDDHDDDHGHAKEKTRFRAILWTKTHAHAEAEPLLVVARRDDAARAGTKDQGAPVNLLAARIPVRFRVADVAAYARAGTDPAAILRTLASREVAFVACGLDIAHVLGRGRSDLAKALKARIGQAATEHRLGVEVLDVSLEDVHPPLAVARAWESETAALEAREARRLLGAAEAARIGPRARADAEAIVYRAQAEAQAKRITAEIEAGRFAALRALDRAAPGVFRNARLLAAIEDATAHVRKVVVSDGTSLDVDLSEKLSASQLDLTGAGAGEESVPPIGSEKKKE